MPRPLRAGPGGRGARAAGLWAPVLLVLLARAALAAPGAPGALSEPPLDLSRTRVSVRSGVWEQAGQAASAQAGTPLRIFVSFTNPNGVPVDCRLVKDSAHVEFNAQQDPLYGGRPQPVVQAAACDMDMTFEGIPSLAADLQLFSVLPEARVELLVASAGKTALLLAFDVLPGPVDTSLSGLGVPLENLTAVAGQAFELDAVLVDANGNLCPSVCNPGALTVYSDASLSYLRLYTAYFDAEHGVCSLTLSEDAANYLEGENVLIRVLGAETVANVTRLPYFQDLKTVYHWGELLRTVERAVPLTVMEDAVWQRWLALALSIVIIIVATIIFVQCGVLKVRNELREQKLAREQAEQVSQTVENLTTSMNVGALVLPARERPSILGSSRNSIDS